jgi:hypothetical protein
LPSEPGFTTKSGAPGKFTSTTPISVVPYIEQAGTLKYSSIHSSVAGSIGSPV